MTQKSIVLQLDTFCYEALSRHLEKEDMTVEKKLDQCLYALVGQLPEMVRRKKIQAIANQLEELKGDLIRLLAEAKAYRDEIPENFLDLDEYDGILSHYATPQDTCHVLDEAVSGLEDIIADLDGLEEE